MKKIRSNSFPRKRSILPAACAALLSSLALLASPAHAADASAWAREGQAAMRLIAGSAKPGATTLRAGIELELAPGWHTYWRYPGDSGIPPRFDFSGSHNLASAKVAYPTPHLYTDETGNTLGYKNRVIFPVQVTPEQPGKPVDLHVKVDYAVCDKLCMPAKGQATLTLSPGTSANETMLTAAEAAVPKPVAPATLGLTTKRVTAAGKPAVDVDLTAPKGEPVHIFAEGPTAEWALPVPQQVAGAPPGKLRFRFQLDGLPPGVSPKAPAELTFTVVEGKQAFQTQSRLD
ncbi:MAG TPA: protein-disulfide reductase DsbD domain-containing protein [Pseudolabrys sp.]|nr:protein-disulfide reductase DsbD domain-containing protein [Pseudolabrys sp.]